MIVSIYHRRLEKGRDLSERHNTNSFSGELDGTSVGYSGAAPRLTPPRHTSSSPPTHLPDLSHPLHDADRDECLIQRCCSQTTYPTPQDHIHRTQHLPGYPTPHIHRDECLNAVLPTLKNEHQIWSRGRFGSWKYEVGNQDHSCILGVEAADSMLFGAKEFTFEFPDKANAKKNLDLRYVPPVGKGKS